MRDASLMRFSSEDVSSNARVSRSPMALALVVEAASELQVESRARWARAVAERSVPQVMTALLKSPAGSDAVASFATDEATANRSTGPIPTSAQASLNKESEIANPVATRADADFDRLAAAAESDMTRAANPRHVDSEAHAAAFALRPSSDGDGHVRTGVAGELNCDKRAHGSSDRDVSNGIANDTSNAVAAKTVSLSALRTLRVANRQGMSDALVASSVAIRDNAASPSADSLVGRLPATLVAHPTTPDRSAATPAQADQLQSLIESCCSRLWVSDRSGAAAHGVMLDIGRWMPGCTIEVSKSAGVLSISLRGVDDAKRRRLERSVADLSDALADKLGCCVVTVVDDTPERQR